jgi:hypothetical protein
MVIKPDRTAIFDLGNAHPFALVRLIQVAAKINKPYQTGELTI